MAKSQTNATNVTMHPLRQTIWGDIWKYTVEKSQTEVTSGCEFRNVIKWLIMWRNVRQYKYVCLFVSTNERQNWNCVAVLSFCNFDKYILKAKLIYFAIWTNTSALLSLWMGCLVISSWRLTFVFYEYDMAIFEHKLPNRKIAVPFLTQWEFSPNGNFPCGGWWWW